MVEQSHTGSEPAGQQTVVVSGVNGYIGGAIANALVAGGHQVIGLSRRDAQPDENVDSRVERVTGEALEVSTIISLMQDADVYIDVAGSDVLTHPRDGGGVERFGRLLAALEGKGKTVVLTSGTGVLSHPARDGAWFDKSYDEQEPLPTPPARLAERVRVEHLLMEASQHVRTIVLRPPMVWGRGGSRHIPALFHCAESTGAVCFVGHGLHCYSHVHVDDLARLYVAAVERGKSGSIYHAVAGEVNWRAVAAAVAEVTGSPTRSVPFSEAVSIWGERNAELLFGVCSRSQSTRTRQELDWSPIHTDLIDDIVNGSYLEHYNLKHSIKRVNPPVKRGD